MERQIGRECHPCVCVWVCVCVCVCVPLCAGYVSQDFPDDPRSNSSDMLGLAATPTVGEKGSTLLCVGQRERSRALLELATSPPQSHSQSHERAPDTP